MFGFPDATRILNFAPVKTPTLLRNDDAGVRAILDHAAHDVYAAATDFAGELMDAQGDRNLQRAREIAKTLNALTLQLSAIELMAYDVIDRLARQQEK